MLIIVHVSREDLIHFGIFLLISLAKDSTNIEEIRSNEDLSMHENEQSSVPSQLEVQGMF